MPKVSVVMPVYNVDKFLEQCLDSIVNQTLKDIEIICVNDGSTDTSGDILNRYAESDPRFVIINQTNSGAAIAKNRGLEVAKGEYLYIMDSDDFVDHNMLEILYNKAISTNSDVVVCDAYSFDNKYQRILPNDYVLFQDYLPEKNSFNAKEYPQYIFNYTAGYYWDKIFKTSLIKDNHLDFPPEIIIFHDAYITFMALVLANKQTYISDKLAYYRVNLTSNMTSRLVKHIDDPLNLIYLIRKRLEEMNCYALYEQSLINVALFWISNIVNMLPKDKLKEFHKLLKTTFFKDFKILKRNKNYFYKTLYYHLVHSINCPVYNFVYKLSRFRVLSHI